MREAQDALLPRKEQELLSLCTQSGLRGASHRLLCALECGMQGAACGQGTVESASESLASTIEDLAPATDDMGHTDLHESAPNALGVTRVDEDS